MSDLQFIKDEKGRIIKAVKNNKCAVINWANENADIEFCNFVIMIVLTGRGVDADV